MKIIALIPARSGSKSVPRKNIRKLCGKPLLSYAIQTALESVLIDRVIVTTDNKEIADIAKKYGGEKEFFYKDAWSLLLPNGQIRQISYFRGYILTDKPHGELDIYMPMRQIFYSNVTKKYTSQASKEDFYDEFKVQIDALKKLLICHIF